MTNPLKLIAESSNLCYVPVKMDTYLSEGQGQVKEKTKTKTKLSLKEENVNSKPASRHKRHERCEREKGKMEKIQSVMLRSGWSPFMCV